MLEYSWNRRFSLKNQIQAVIFDWGNVLGRFDKNKVYKRLSSKSRRCNTAEDVRQALSIVEGVEGLTHMTETGSIDEGELFDIVCSVLLLTGVGFDEFCEIWGNMISPNHGVDEVVASICPDVGKFVLSNTEPIHWSYIEQLPVMQRFFSDPRLLIRSYTVRARKPDERIFREGIRRAGVPPEKILYVDDIPEYTEAFEALGGRALLYDCSKDSLSKLEDSLSSLGILV